MYRPRIAILSVIIGMFLLPMPVSAQFIEIRNAQFAKLSERFYIGYYCIVADGTANTAIRPFFGLVSGVVSVIPIVALFMKEMSNQAADKISLNKGQGYCIWLQVSNLGSDNSPIFERRDMVFAKRSRRIYTKKTSYQFRIYNDGNQVGAKNGEALNHSRSWTEVIPGTDRASQGSVGIAGCIEPTIEGGQIASLVIKSGRLPPRLTATPAPVATRSCNDRKAEFSLE